MESAVMAIQRPAPLCTMRDHEVLAYTKNLRQSNVCLRSTIPGRQYRRFWPSKTSSTSDKSLKDLHSAFSDVKSSEILHLQTYGGTTASDRMANAANTSGPRGSPHLPDNEDNNLTSPTSLRPLDAIETFWEAFHGVGGVVIMNVVSVLTSHPIEISQLQEAANILMKRHQVLRCCVAWDDVGSKRRDNSQVKHGNSARSTSLASPKRVCRSTGIPMTESSTARRKNFRWVEMNPVRIDVEEAELSDSCSAALAPESLHWLESLGLEQQDTFDTKKGPLWRLRLLPSVRCSPQAGEEKTISQTDENGGNEDLFHYRTYVVGKFHHSVMDGLSRQEFWNELCCVLAVICHRELLCGQKGQQQTKSYLNALKDKKNTMYEVEDVSSQSASEIPRTRIPDSVSSRLPRTVSMCALRPLMPLLEIGVQLTKLQRKVMAKHTNPFSACAYPPLKYGDARVTAHTSIIPLWLPADVAQRFQKLCKLRGVTVNGAITIVAGLAMAKLMWNKDSVRKAVQDASMKYSKFLPTLTATKSRTKTSSSPTTSPHEVKESADTNRDEGCGCIQRSKARVAKAVSFYEAFTGSVISNFDDPDCFPLPSKTPSCAVSRSYAPWVFAQRFSRAFASSSKIDLSREYSNAPENPSPMAPKRRQSKRFPHLASTFASKQSTSPSQGLQDPSVGNSEQRLKNRALPSRFRRRCVSIGTMQAISSRRWMPSCKSFDKAQYRRDFTEYLHSYLLDHVKSSATYYSAGSNALSAILNDTIAVASTVEPTESALAACDVISCNQTEQSGSTSIEGEAEAVTSTTCSGDEYITTVSVGGCEHRFEENVLNSKSPPINSYWNASSLPSSHLGGHTASCPTPPLLIFDGDNFSQHLQSKEAEKQALELMTSVAGDCRMESPSMLVHAMTTASFPREKNVWDSPSTDISNSAASADSSIPADCKSELNASAQLSRTRVPKSNVEMADFRAIRLSTNNSPLLDAKPSHLQRRFTSLLFKLKNRRKPPPNSPVDSATCTSAATPLPPGLGSYAVLMPLQLNIDSRCDNDPDVFWECAAKTAKAVHHKVNQPKPTRATLRWEIISTFVRGAAANDSVLRRVASPKPRPSSFLISNGGKWDDSLLLQVLSSLHSEWLSEVQVIDNQDPCASRSLQDQDVPVTDSTLMNSHDGDSGNFSTSPELFHIKVESSWSCVSQHHAGINLFSHNVVSLGGRICWSLQYHTNLTNKRLATEYGILILRVINDLVEKEQCK